MVPLRLRRSGIAALLLVVYLPACTSWRVGTPTPQAFLEREHPRTIQVTRRDGHKLMLSAPEVRGDSLTGIIRGSDYVVDTTRVTLALPDIQSVAVEKFSAGKAFLVTGAILAGSLAAWVIACEAQESWGCP